MEIAALPQDKPKKNTILASLSTLEYERIFKDLQLIKIAAGMDYLRSVRPSEICLLS